MTKIEQIKERLEKASKELGKNFSINYPFYCVVEKPRSSLSKHDRERPTYWHMDDGIFVAYARDDIEYLTNRLEKAIDYLKQGKKQFTPNTTNSDVDMFLKEIDNEIK